MLQQTPEMSRTTPCRTAPRQSTAGQQQPVCRRQVHALHDHRLREQPRDRRRHHIVQPKAARGRGGGQVQRVLNGGTTASAALTAMPMNMTTPGMIQRSTRLSVSFTSGFAALKGSPRRRRQVEVRQHRRHRHDDHCQRERRQQRNTKPTRRPPRDRQSTRGCSQRRCGPSLYAAVRPGDVRNVSAGGGRRRRHQRGLSHARHNHCEPGEQASEQPDQRQPEAERKQRTADDIAELPRQEHGAAAEAAAGAALTTGLR